MFNVVNSLASIPAIERVLTTSPIVKKVPFTGSANVGKLLMQQSSSTIKKFSLELGGNAPFIVFDGCANIDAAVAGCVAAKFRSIGQTCVCANRIYVQSRVYDTFAEKLTEAVSKFLFGFGFNSDPTHGPLVSVEGVDKAESHVRHAVANDALVAIGGVKAPELGPNFFQPTVLNGLNHDTEIVRCETFGPVAALFEFSTEDDVVKMANDSEVDLAGYFYTQDVDKAWRVLNRLDVGIVGVNTGLISDSATPFGGVKEPGFGKEGSKYGIEDYTVLKTVTFTQHKL